MAAGWMCGHQKTKKQKQNHITIKWKLYEMNEWMKMNTTYSLTYLLMLYLRFASLCDMSAAINITAK